MHALKSTRRINQRAMHRRWHDKQEQKSLPPTRFSFPKFFSQEGFVERFCEPQTTLTRSNPGLVIRL
jgi:hypothetical protein